jgi:hypothetical protein
LNFTGRAKGIDLVFGGGKLCRAPLDHQHGNGRIDCGESTKAGGKGNNQTVGWARNILSVHFSSS